MLAQKQPLIKRVRNSSLVEWSCAENLTGLKSTPKLGLLEVRNELPMGKERKRREMAIDF